MSSSQDEHPTYDTTLRTLPGYKLLAGRQGQLRSRPGGRRPGDPGLSGIVRLVRANRAFLARTVRYLAGEEGIRQFLDIGTGIPTANNTHEVAQSVSPGARVVYVDNDPVVLATPERC